MRFHIRTILAKHWIAGLLIFIALILRLWNIGETVTFLGDQGRDAIIMRDILLAKHFPAIGPPTSIGQIYMGPFFYYFMAPWLAISLFNPIGPAIGTAVLSVTGLLFFYIVLYRLAGKQTALLGLFFTVFSYTLTAYARFSWNPNLLPYVSFVLVCLFFYYVKKPSILLAIVAGAFSGISLQFHVLSVLVILPLFGYMLLNKKYKGFLCAFTGALFASVPLIIFDLRHNFLNVKNFLALVQKPGGAQSISYFAGLVDTAQGYIYSMLHISIPGWISLCIITLVAALVLWKATRKKHSFILLNFFIVIFFLLCFSAIGSMRFPHYFGSIMLPGYLLLAYLLPSRKKCMLCWSALIIILVLFLLANIYTPLTRRDSVSQIKKAQQIADSIASIAKKGPIQIATIPSTETDEHYRYFIMRDYPGLSLRDKYSTDAPNELYVLCVNKKCNPLGDGQWHIAAFTNKTLGTNKVSNGIKIYQLLHGNATIK